MSCEVVSRSFISVTMWRLTLVVTVGAALAIASGAPADPDTVIIEASDHSTVTAEQSTNTDGQSTTTARVTSANDIDSSKSELIHINSTENEGPVHRRYPHAVLFSRTCGGSIISPKWILTAGHCTIFASGRYVLAGTSVSDNGSGVAVLIKRRVIHPRFAVGPYWLNSETFGIRQVGARYDFLLVELQEALPINGKDIAVIPLDEEVTHSEGIEVGYAGYGAVHHGETMQHTMHEMKLQTLSDESCSRRFAEFDKQDQLCVRGRPPRYDSACNGDSGSGLVGEGKLMGVASWVEDDAITCRPGTIVVFSRVAAVRDWIRQVTGV